MTDRKPRNTLIVSLVALSASLAGAASAQTPRFPITQEAPRGDGLRMPKPNFPIRNPSNGEGETAAGSYSASVASPASSGSRSAMSSSPLPDAAPSTVRAPAAVSSRELAPLDAQASVSNPDNGAFEIALAQTRSRRSGSAARETSASEYVVKRGETLASIARALGISQDALAEANNLRSPFRVDAGQRLKVPGAEGGLRGSVGAEIAGSYKVERGDTLASIAKAQGVSIQDLAAANNLRSPYRLTAGQTLKVPGSAEPARSGTAPSRTGSERRAESSTHTVAPGDTLFALARKYDTTPSAIAEASGISASAGLRVGQKLTIPGQGASTSVRDEPEAARPAPVTSRPNQVRPSREEPAAETSGAGSGPGGGRVITVDAPAKTYTVKKGDNLDSIADRMGMSRRELASLNGLKSPYRLTVGQRLKGGAAKAKAYVVESGDTLAVVAQRFGVTTRALAAENNLRATAALRSGQRLILPEGFRDRGAPRAAAGATAPAAGRETAPAPAPSREANLPSAPQPYSGAPTRPNSPPPATSRPQIADAPPTLSEAEIVAAGKGRFVWPLTGEILSDFGPKAGSQRNDGLNIRANNGETVRAAAAGEVVYAGDQVPGFGNLVLVKHADGWVTAYAHLGRTDVKMRQQVAQGQQIGQAGATGGVAEPQLHFEVRYAPSPKEKARPINPSLVLPH